MVKKVLVLAATLVACTTAYAADPYLGPAFQSQASTLIYMSLPLDGASRKEKAPAYGFAIQGQTKMLAIDTKMMSNLGIESVGGLDVKWLLAGAAAAGAAMA